MKKSIIFLLIAFLFLNCGGKSTNSIKVDIKATNTAEAKLPDIIDGAYFCLINNQFNFGEVSSGKSPIVPVEVKFTNPGTKPLLILEAVVSCGCLKVDFPKKPIYPNQNGIITINIEMKGQEGVFNKNVYFRTNEGNMVKAVQLNGYVEK